MHHFLHTIFVFAMIQLHLSVEPATDKLNEKRTYSASKKNPGMFDMSRKFILSFVVSETLQAHCWTVSDVLNTQYSSYVVCSVRALEPAKPPHSRSGPAPFFSLKQVVKQNLDKKNLRLFFKNICIKTLVHIFDKWNDIQMSLFLQIFRIESWICYDLMRFYHRLIYQTLY